MQVKDNVILADEMGLGKTIQAIAYLGALWQVHDRLVQRLHRALLTSDVFAVILSLLDFTCCAVM
jgi:SNF2 family DNA or RNA helicase